MIPVVPVESCTHVLAEFDCLDPLLSALRLDSGRIKCTCLSVSRKWLALGTSAGGLHLIQRDGWKQKLILTHKEGSITQVSCCPHDEDFIAVATSQGLVVVWELHLEHRGRPERASVSWEHRGVTVTSLCWDTAALRVFAGESFGSGGSNPTCRNNKSRGENPGGGRARLINVLLRRGPTRDLNIACC
nr:Zgc:162420 protein [Danio rerio]